jgi:hypothetical protein
MANAWRSIDRIADRGDSLATRDLLLTAVDLS